MFDDQLTVGEAHEAATEIEASVAARFPFFIRKRAPVSGMQSLLDYEGRWISETLAGQTTVWAEVGVPVKTLCPCSKEISDYGAHNQRSHVTIRIELLGEIKSSTVFETIEILERGDNETALAVAITGLPVFLHRRFRHGFAFVMVDSRGMFGPDGPR